MPLNVEKLVAELEKRKAKIGHERDQLRRLVGEYEVVVETCDRAEEAINEAIDALSEMV